MAARAGARVHGPIWHAEFLSAGECRQIIDLAVHRELSNTKLSGGVGESRIRSATGTWFDLDEIPALDMKLHGKLIETVREVFPFVIDGFEEGGHLLRYEGQNSLGSADFYDWHNDIGHSGSSASRKLTFLIQLSDPADYEGGRLEVNGAGSSELMPAEQGSLVIFPSFALHRVTPVERGTRWSLAAWAHGPAFR